MGARIDSQPGGTAPLTVHGRSIPLNAIRYELPVASAQVKSCVLLAGLYAKGCTEVIEPAPTRDHTERMLRGFGCEVMTDQNRIVIEGGQQLLATNIEVPADISSAAFFLVAASIAPDSELTLSHVGINPTRTGIIDILELMGANITLINERDVGGEPVADIVVRSARLKGIEIPPRLVPLAIDEFPVLFVAAACAEGCTVLTGAEELRVKESDRIQVMADGLQTLGIDAQPTADGMVIHGGELGSGTVESHGDHRISMAFVVASLRANGPVTVLDCDNVNTSFPGFSDLARHTGFDITVQD
jgi:3-phosphoshikimate 1-carboxyvinyltransferase